MKEISNKHAFNDDLFINVLKLEILYLSSPFLQGSFK